MDCFDPNLVSQWLDGGAADLDEGTRRAVHDHLDTCEDCRLLFAELGREIAPATSSRADEGPLLVGATVDRYVLVEWLGEGGMGVVYAAYDPSLERRVALKLLRPTGEATDPAGTRLLAEAKALARISHPHVVTVHDAGTHEGRVFVAMEHLAGGTLASWQAAGEHSVEAVVTRYCEAGRGLAAAHDAGFVHRDIKPSNLMIDGEGRTKVTDFGLARAAVDPGRAAGGSVSWLGTPAYVSPEQRAGGPVDARSDQYAFCVALHEALYGAVPGEEATRDRRHPSVPSHVSDALARGLSTDPEKRFPDMRELLAGLRPPRARSRFTVPLVVAAIAVLVAVVGVSARVATRGSRLCGGASARWSGVWDDARREKMAAAFAATGAPYAADAWREVARSLDDYAARWSASYTDTCEATRVRGEQSEARLDERMACLDDARAAVRVTADLFAAADRKIVENALAEVGALPKIDACDHRGLAGASGDIVTDPATGRAIAELRESLARARAESAAGKYDDAERIASELAGAAASTGSRSLESDVAYVLGRAQAGHGDGAASARTLYRALAAAEEARDDRAKARASAELGFVYAQRLDRPDDAEHATELAHAILTRLPDEIDVRAQVQQTEAAVADARGHYDDSAASSKRAIALLEGAYGADDFRVAVALNNASAAPLHLGHLDEAKALLTRSVAILEERLGPHHPLLAISLNSLAIAELDLHQTALALPHAQRSLDIWTEATPGSTNLIQAEGVVASILSEEKRFAEALPHAERSFELVNQLAPSRSMLHAEAGDTLGFVLVALHDYDRALTTYQDVLATCAAAHCPAHVMSESLYELGLAYEAKGEPTKAVDPLRRAVAIRSDNGADEVKLAEASFVLGRVLWTSGDDRPGGRAAVEGALAVFTAHPESAEDGPEATTWLAEHPR